MENSLQLPQTHLKARAHSLNNLSSVGLGIRILEKDRWVSFANIQNAEQAKSCCTLEIFYKITDIVLVICAVLFTVSSIASIVIWIYGLNWIVFTKDLF
jgi:hypothetical protein